jgi:hypothetical protein
MKDILRRIPVIQGTAESGKRFGTYLGGLTRRQFLKIGAVGAAALALLTSCDASLSPSEKQLANALTACKDILPPDDPPIPAPVDKAEFDRYDDFHQADFLLRGGYVKEWLVQKDAPSFFYSVAQACCDAIVPVYAKLMSTGAQPDPDTLKSRYFIAPTQDEYRKIMMEKTGWDFDQANAYVLHAFGNSAYDTQGNIVCFTNIPLMVQARKNTFQFGLTSGDNGSVNTDVIGGIVRGISNNFGHELSHCAGSNTYTPEDIAALKNNLSKIWSEDIIDIVTNPKNGALGSGLEIRFISRDSKGVMQGNHILSESFINSDVRSAMFDESVREFMQRNFRMRLDYRLSKDVTPYFSDYPEFMGNLLIRHLHDSLKISHDGITDLLDDYKYGGQDKRMKNVEDLLQFYVEEAKKQNITVSETQVLYALRNIEVASQFIYDKIFMFTSRSASPDKATEDIAKANLFLDFKSIFDMGKNQIDKALQKEPVVPTPGSISSNWLNYRLTWQREQQGVVYRAHPYRS